MSSLSQTGFRYHLLRPSFLALLGLCLSFSEAFLAKERVVFGHRDIEIFAEVCELHSVFKLSQGGQAKSFRGGVHKH